jgi:hypothetical protein
MKTMSLRSRNGEPPSSLSVVRWRGFDGVPVSSYPLPRHLAEVVARAFAATYPRVSFWVEDIPWLPPGAPASGVPEPARPAAPVPRPSALERPPFVAP